MVLTAADKPKGLRQGLGSWDAVKDRAQASGIESSLDTPAIGMFNGTEQSGTLDFLAHKMRFEPRQVEQGLLNKLNEHIDKMLDATFGDITKEINQFFARIEAEGGDFTKLEAVDLERMILSIQRVVYIATDTVAGLYNDAYVADRIQNDEYWAAYKELEGNKPTIGDRQAHAYEKSRDSRFYYYYVFLVWQRLNQRLSALNALLKSMEWFRSRSLKDRPF